MTDTESKVVEKLTELLELLKKKEIVELVKTPVEEPVKTPVEEPVKTPAEEPVCILKTPINQMKCCGGNCMFGVKYDCTDDDYEDECFQKFVSVLFLIIIIILFFKFGYQLGHF